MNNESILIGMSGGLDSTIAAYRLMVDGYKVSGVHFRSWKWGCTESNLQKENFWLNKLSEALGIEITIVDRRDDFEKYVINKYIKLIEEGFTPNPCIICNPLYKFSSLIKIADERKIDYVATGHYAINKRFNTEWRVYKGRDCLKDQSYMLCLMSQRILARTIMPLGSTTKNENKKLARRIGLDFSNIPESQDLCFVDHSNHKIFLKEFIKSKLVPGAILDTKGISLGQHKGLALYTIGQRKGIQIPSEKPYYVVRKDLENNTLIIGYKDNLGCSGLILDSINWISKKNIHSLECEVKIRYHSKSKIAFIEKKERGYYHVTFKHKIPDLTPGQYAVLYNHDEMLGGGMILKVLD